MRPTCIDMVFELAKRDARVAYIGSDLDPPLTRRMKEEMPSRAFMEGVSEQHVVGMAAGLAMEGFIPFVHTIATFITRRCYEQVRKVCPGSVYDRLATGHLETLGAGGVPQRPEWRQRQPARSH